MNKRNISIKQGKAIKNIVYKGGKQSEQIEDH